MDVQHNCVECGISVIGSYVNRKYCSTRCKARWRKKNPANPTNGHACRICGVIFPLLPGQGNKWLCSVECRKASAAKSVRNFHVRQPLAEKAYRAKTKAKKLPEGNLVRFRRTNPDAPRECESCGDDRVLDVAHKPGFERFGAHRSPANCQWPNMVWVLCPTCHALLDRMHYPPEDLNLTV